MLFDERCSWSAFFSFRFGLLHFRCAHVDRLETAETLGMNAKASGPCRIVVALQIEGLIELEVEAAH